MDQFLGIGIMLAVALLGVAAVWKTMDSKFPGVNINVRHRGTIKKTKYRLLGTAIVKDNLFKILLNEFEYCGDISLLDYQLAPNGARIYDAYNRYDYLVGMKHENKDEVQLYNTRPAIVIEGDLKAKMKFGESLLVPFKIHYANETLSEKEVKNGKDIAARFIESQKSAERFLQANNPIMAVVIASIPMVLMALLFCVMLYVAYLGLGSNAEKIMASTAQIAGACAR